MGIDSRKLWNAAPLVLSGVALAAGAFFWILALVSKPIRPAAGVRANCDILTELAESDTPDHRDAIDARVAHGADINCFDTRGFAPLHVAVEFIQAGMVKHLLSLGADPSLAARGGVTPLHVACAQGATDLATLLVGVGADVDPATEDGTTPLLLAARDGPLDLVTLLLNAGASATKADKAGATPLAIAQERGDEAVLKAIESRIPRVESAPSESEPARR